MTELRILQGDVLEQLATLPERSVHVAITSPPYWGLRRYIADDAPEKVHEIGLEPTPEAWCRKMVEVFRAVRRVLRDDGCLWLNVGDAYASQGGSGRQGETGQRSDRTFTLTREGGTSPPPGLKPLDLIGLPWMLAFALRSDGWFLRSATVWAKGLSFCDAYAGSVMPESVNGTRWERCRVKVAACSAPNSGGIRGANQEEGWTPETHPGTRTPARYEDCPGCPRCSPNGGYVLRRGSWRPTSAYEMVFLLAKSANYFADGEAVREAASANAHPHGEGSHQKQGTVGVERANPSFHAAVNNTTRADMPSTRNLRNVWCINPQPFAEAHFATFPEALVEPCLLASTSALDVCPACGAPWARVVEKTKNVAQADRMESRRNKPKGDEGRATAPHAALVEDYRTLGWRPTCSCPAHEPVPATCLDPFLGSGTTALVALRHNRNAIGIELNPDYIAIARRRLAEVDAMLPGM